MSALSNAPCRPPPKQLARALLQPDQAINVDGCVFHSSGNIHDKGAVSLPLKNVEQQVLFSFLPDPVSNPEDAP
ncbi:MULTISPECIES: hypothetical protein [unclassified Pseudomonas]|uniref:hypothetical protein n=1 Tax=unclassified Pseudomonas TaxID=196821 RepID=UPI00128CD930|nr:MULTISPECIES: hypothetical protein [unclassified Pseudomonas]MPQ65966.1 hypothetical protein [Pseudomonas sp. MWU12-2323]